VRHTVGSDLRSATILTAHCCILATLPVFIMLLTAQFIRQYNFIVTSYVVHRTQHVMAERVSVAKMFEEIQNKG
jgi:hypothetical protein